MEMIPFLSDSSLSLWQQWRRTNAQKIARSSIIAACMLQLVAGHNYYLAYAVLDLTNYLYINNDDLQMPFETVGLAFLLSPVVGAACGLLTPTCVAFWGQESTLWYLGMLICLSFGLLSVTLERVVCVVVLYTVVCGAASGIIQQIPLNVALGYNKHRRGLCTALVFVGSKIAMHALIFINQIFLTPMEPNSGTLPTSPSLSSINLNAIKKLPEFFWDYGMFFGILTWAFVEWLFPRAEDWELSTYDSESQTDYEPLVQKKRNLVELVVSQDEYDPDAYIVQLVSLVVISALAWSSMHVVGARWDELFRVGNKSYNLPAHIAFSIANIAKLVSYVFWGLAYDRYGSMQCLIVGLCFLLVSTLFLGPLMGLSDYISLVWLIILQVVSAGVSCLIYPTTHELVGQKYLEAANYIGLSRVAGSFIGTLIGRLLVKKVTRDIAIAIIAHMLIAIYALFQLELCND